MEPTTQLPTAQPEQSPTKGLDRFDPVKDRCVKMFGSEDRFLQEASFLLRIVNETPAVQECTPASIVGVLVNVASTGLSLNSVLKLCYVIPRNVKIKTPGKPDRWEKRACVEPSYMGLMKLATDTGSVKQFEAQVVYKGDEFDFDLVDKRPRTHKPYWTIGAERGKLIGVYGFATLVDGSIVPEHMGADELAKIRSKSDNANGAVYADWEGEMARKALLKRLQKYIPRTDRSEAFLTAVEIDNEGYELAKKADEPDALTAKVNDIRKKLKGYQGGDASDIIAECQALSAQNSWTHKYADAILAKLAGQPVAQ